MNEETLKIELVVQNNEVINNLFIRKKYCVDDKYSLTESHIVVMIYSKYKYLDFRVDSLSKYSKFNCIDQEFLVQIIYDS